jgi:hypothetical protein
MKRKEGRKKKIKFIGKIWDEIECRPAVLT